MKRLDYTMVPVASARRDFGMRLSLFLLAQGAQQTLPTEKARPRSWLPQTAPLPELLRGGRTLS